MASIFFHFVIVTIFASKVITSENIIRTIQNGQILGKVEPPVEGYIPVEKYYGIPFAEPPLDELRFEDPVPALPWQPNVRPALELPPACPQIGEDMSYIAQHRVDPIETNEDCLYLNVFVPVLSNASRVPVPGAGVMVGIPDNTTYGNIRPNKLPVMVFIHGGSNVVGSGNMFDGDVLAAVGEIVVICINYRLAALGFLGTGDADFPGNYGLLDMIAALQWVQDNIGAFNGDPGKVTVLGHSAAAMDVGILLVSPMAKGLFRTVISQSGPPSSIVAVRWPDHNSTREVLDLGTLVGCTENTVIGVKKCLKKVDVLSLLPNYPVYDWYQFPAIVDGKVLPASPVEMLKTGEINAETYLIGTTRDEAGMWAYELKGYENISNILILSHALPAAIQFKDLVRFEYTDVTVPENATTDVRIASQVYGDALFDAPTIGTLQMLAARNVALNQYRFEWRSDATASPEVSGVPHGSDLFFLFGSPIRGHALYNYTEIDKQMSIVLMKQYGNFVKHSSFDVNAPEWKSLVKERDITYNNNTMAYTRFYKDQNQPAIDLGFNLKPRQATFWNSVVSDLRDQIDRTLKNWSSTDPNRPTTIEPNRPDDGELGRQKELFLILFIVFLVLSCLLLLLLLFVCVMYCMGRNSSNYGTK